VGLRDYIRLLEGRRELLKVTVPLSTRLEISALLRLGQQKTDKGIWVLKPYNFDASVVGNLFLKRDRVALAMGVENQGEGIKETYQKRINTPQGLEICEGEGPWELNFEKEVDLLSQVPALVHHQGDAGPYMTCSVVVSKDPETKERGIGIHRVQLKSERRFGILLANPPLMDFFAKAEKMQKPLEVAIVNGVDPCILLAAVLPTKGDKMLLAATLSGRPLRLQKCKYVDLEVPYDSEFVIEGVLQPGLREKEGPFGENTGYYITFENPVGEVFALAKRERAIYHALLPFSREADLLLNVAWELEKLKVLKERFPSIQRVRFLHMRFLAIVQVKDPLPGETKEILDFVLSERSVKIAMVVDEDVNLDDDYELLWAIATRLDLKKGLLVREGLPGSWIDPFVAFGEVKSPKGLPLVTKLGIDATKPFGLREVLKKVDIGEKEKEKAKALLLDLLSNI